MKCLQDGIIYDINLKLCTHKIRYITIFSDDSEHNNISLLVIYKKHLYL